MEAKGGFGVPDAVTDWLPELILEEKIDGGYHGFIAAVYGVFRRDFVETMTQFRGKPIRVIPALRDGKEITFWHMISEGSGEEDDREVKLDRCRRICWPRAMLAAAGTEKVLIWPSSTRGNRFLVAIPDFSYLVVIEERATYCFVVTAFCVEQSHRRKKLERDFQNAKAKGFA